jgi:Ribbon-helix-helix protein, copG family
MRTHNLTCWRWDAVLSCVYALGLVSCYHDLMARNLTVRLDDQLAADTQALARAEGKSLNETVKQALREAAERRRSDPEFKARVKRIIEEDRELLERLAR